jgi:SAM-dependent MidA family methyltransferase
LTPLARLLRERIRANGPISLADYMGEALAHPEHGYYRSRDPLGVAGDFTTAPEISQMFGELIGLWCAVLWQSMGSPAQVVLAELGPGRGTLMADLLRAAAMVPDFRRAVSVHLVETSLPLRAKQAERLAGVGAVWHDDISTLPPGPLLLVANEFFDALPVHQWIRRSDGWHERMIDADGDALVFVDGPLAHGLVAPVATEGAIFETNPDARAIAGRIGQRLTASGGAALLIDYGHPTSALGDTVQAVRHHAYAPVLESPGEADLTAHVDFQALSQAARPAKCFGPVTQGGFLRALGIELRCERLARSSPDKAGEIAAACRRLIDASEMGTLFKALAMTQPMLPAPPGFAA